MRLRPPAYDIAQLGQVLKDKGTDDLLHKVLSFTSTSPLSATASDVDEPRADWSSVDDDFSPPHSPTHATKEDLKECFRFNSKDYDALPELAWETILAIFAREGKTDHLLEAMQDLAELDGMEP